MDQNMSQFNLIDEPWVSVVYIDGHPEDVSLKTLFRDASNIREIVGDIPQQTLPLLRLMLAILYSAYSGEGAARTDPEKLRFWIHIWNKENFDIELIGEYLAEFYDRFYLIDRQRPFMQVPGLSYLGKKEYDPVSEMIADVPKPEKFLFSLRARNSINDVSLAEAARWLVFLQAYDTAGIKTPVDGNTYVNKGKVYAPKGSVGTGWLGAIGGVYLEGSNLFETLMLNWPLVDARSGNDPLFGNEDDLPTWERPVSGPNLEVKNSPVGPADLFTWQDRRIRLLINDAGHRVVGHICCYGDILTAADKQAFETMTAWRLSKEQQKKLGTAHLPYMPQPLDSSKAIWRGLEPLLMASAEHGDLRPTVIRWMERMREEAGSGKLLSKVSIHSQGISYGTQSSVYEDGIDDSIDIDASLLRHDSPAVAQVIQIVGQADDGVFELIKLVHRVEGSAGDKRGGNSLNAASDDVREYAYDRLDRVFRTRIENFDPTQDVLSYGQSWREEICRVLLNVGEQYIADSNASSFLDREVGRLSHMTAARAAAIFRGSVYKALGLTRQTNHVDTSEV